MSQRLLSSFYAITIILLTIFTAQTSYAKSNTSTLTKANSPCNTNYFNQQLPTFINQKLAEDTQPLCFDGFAVMYSGKSKTALWSAELLTKARITQATGLERVNNFHPEARLPNSIRAELADYSHSAYDRGHLAPNADMATTTQQYDSFSLANIVPQNPNQNRSLWKTLETNTRSLAIKHNKIYVVTGVVFTGNAIKQLNKRILIPTHLYKAIYIPNLQQAGVYYSPNDDSQRVEIISLSELSKRTGIDLFPSVPTTVKATAMPLAINNLSTTSEKSQKTSPKDEDSTPNKFIVRLISAIIEWFINLFK